MESTNINCLVSQLYAMSEQVSFLKNDPRGWLKTTLGIIDSLKSYAVGKPRALADLSIHEIYAKQCAEKASGRNWQEVLA